MSTLNIPYEIPYQVPDRWQDCITTTQLSYWLINQIQNDILPDIVTLQGAIVTLNALATDAQTTANTAIATANASVNTATNAYDMAEQADGNATLALTRANTALTNANTAQQAANTASGLATNAQTTANNALSTAGQASVIAQQANNWVLNQQEDFTVADGEIIVPTTYTSQNMQGRTYVVPDNVTSADTTLFINMAGSATFYTQVSRPGTIFYISFNGRIVPSTTDLLDLVPNTANNGSTTPLSALSSNSTIQLIRRKTAASGGQLFDWIPITI